MTTRGPPGFGPSPAAPPPAADPHAPDGPVADVVSGLAEERRLLDALAAVRLSIRLALLKLRHAGLSWQIITARVVRAQGRTLPVGERLQMSDAFRKRCAPPRRPHLIVEEWPSAR